MCVQVVFNNLIYGLFLGWLFVLEGEKSVRGEWVNFQAEMKTTTVLRHAE